MSCNRIKEIEPDSPLGYYGDGNANFHTGDIARTLKGFSEAIQRDPEDYEMLSAMCFFWVNLGDAKQADKWQQRADAIGAGQPMPIRTRLILYKFREQHELASALAKQTLDRKIEDRFGTQYLFRHTWAFESARKGDYQAALTPYREEFPWAFETPLLPPVDLRGAIGDIVQMAGLLKLAEPLSPRWRELLTIAEDNISHQSMSWGLWVFDLTHAAIATINNEPEIAIDWLNQAWDKNWRLDWRRSMFEDAIFVQLTNEPGFQELITRFEADMERQLEEAYVLMGISQ